MKWLKLLARLRFKAQSPEIRRQQIRFEMAVRDIERQREATRIRIAQRSGTTRYLG